MGGQRLFPRATARGLVPVIVGLAVSPLGCGSSTHRSAAGASSPTSSAGAASASSARRPDVRSPDERRALGAAEAYVRAFAASDWPAVCAVRTRAERASLARLGGSCPRAFRRIARRNARADHTPQNQPAALATFYPTSVRRRGGVIGIHFASTKYAGELKVAAVRDGKDWLLADIPDSQVP